MIPGNSRELPKFTSAELWPGYQPSDPDPGRRHIGLDPLCRTAEQVIAERRDLTLGVGLAHHLAQRIGPGAKIGVIAGDLAAARVVGIGDDVVDRPVLLVGSPNASYA